MDILVDIQVIRTIILYKMTQGRKSKGKKRKTKESQTPATQDKPQAPEVSEESEVTEEQPEASQEMPPSITQTSCQAHQKKMKRRTKDAQY